MIPSDGFEAAVTDLTEGCGVDVVIDQVGGAARPSLNVLRPSGQMVVMGNASDADDVSLSALELWFTSKGVLGFNLQLISATDPERVGAAMREASNRLAREEVRVDVTSVLPFADAAEAHRRIEQRATTGKLVLRVREDNA